MADTNPVNISSEIAQRINTALVSKRPVTVAYVSPEGQPVQTFRGSTHVHSPTQLAIWVRNEQGGLLAGVAKNPKISFMFRDNDARELFEFRGSARVSTDAADREKVYSESPEPERNHDPDMHGIALIIDVDAVNGFFRDAAGEMAPVAMKR